MRTVLRLAALFIALVTLVLWLFGGPNMGWTTTTEMMKTKDPVTGLETKNGETGFLPGLDFLVAGLAGSSVVWGLSFVARKK